jgi:hypothetical protein
MDPDRKEEKIMNLIERYIYAVVRYLPARQRQDIEQELHGIIDDMLAQRVPGGEPGKADIEAVLLELGNPRKLADNYRGTARYLIGPAFFEIYWLVLRIVLAAVLIGTTIAFVVDAATTPPAQPWPLIGGYLENVWSSLLTAFALVTLGFAANEYFNQQYAGKVSQKLDEWKLADLPQIPTSSLVAKRSDSIAALIFTLLFLLVVNIDIDLIGFYVKTGANLEITPLLSEHFLAFLPWINLSLGLVIILESSKLIVGHWNWPILLGSILQKVINLAVGVQLFRSPAIFNPAFFQKINTVFAANAEPMPANLPALILKILMILLIVGFVADMIAMIIKGIRLAAGRRG